MDDTAIREEMERRISIWLWKKRLAYEERRAVMPKPVAPVRKVIVDPWRRRQQIMNEIGQRRHVAAEARRLAAR